MSYSAPLQDLEFIFRHLIDLPALAGLPPFADLELTEDTASAILGEAARVAAEVMAPANRIGDSKGAELVDGRVRLPDEFAAIQKAMRDGGWVGISLPARVGGQGLPALFNTVTAEFWNSANMAFALNPTLCIGAANAILAHGSDEQVEKFLRPIAEGRWSGTMNLTEPQAGSDLGTVKTRAERHGDHYRISGQKIYITWGEHELTENIVHLVLARLPDAPEGTRGISLFIVPKVLVNDDGSIGERNDVQCLSLEHKMGIHASPTCVMSYGEEGGAVGYLVGEEHKGLAYMFTMMNEARLIVGVQGLAVGEAAYRKALAYARERVQGGMAIVHHPDVARMLMTQKALVEAMRAVACVESVNLDFAHPNADGKAQKRADLMIPVIKGWFTELGQEVASLGIQVHGGMGYIEETGAAQFYRDVRIAAIYEGTNGIQAADLVTRKLGRDRGQAMAALMVEMQRDIDAAVGAGLSAEAGQLQAALDAHRKTTDQLLATLQSDLPQALLNSFDYLMATGFLCGGWQMLRTLIVVRGRENAGYREKCSTARFYLSRLLPRAGLHQQLCLEAIQLAEWHPVLTEGLDG